MCLVDGPHIFLCPFRTFVIKLLPDRSEHMRKKKDIKSLPIHFYSV